MVRSRSFAFHEIKVVFEYKIVWTTLAIVEDIPFVLSALCNSAVSFYVDDIYVFQVSYCFVNKNILLRYYYFRINPGKIFIKITGYVRNVTNISETENGWIEKIRKPSGELAVPRNIFLSGPTFFQFRLPNNLRKFCKKRWLYP